MILLSLICMVSAVWAIQGYLDGVNGVSVANATLSTLNSTLSECVSACNKTDVVPEGCVGFAVNENTCDLFTYTEHFAIVAASASTTYYQRIPSPNMTAIVPAVSFVANGYRSGVELRPSLLKLSQDINRDFLLGHETDDLLYFFRIRSGEANPPGQCFGWDGGLRGSIAGLFLMGAGNQVRYDKNERLIGRIQEVVEGIVSTQEGDGYAMAFFRNESGMHENPNYVTSWLTLGLIDAASVTPDGVDVARKHMNWFYSNEYLPQFLPPEGGWNASPPPPGWDGVIHDGYGAASGHLIYLMYQGIVARTGLGLNSGVQADVDIVEKLYREDWWLRGLIERNETAIWRRHFFSHNYEIVGMMGYLDLYRLTGNQTYLDAIMGFRDLMLANWIHVGGSIAINEDFYYPPKSYLLDYTTRTHNIGNEAKCAGPQSPRRSSPKPIIDGPTQPPRPTGELCGSVFWTLLNHDLHQLDPRNESYAIEVERSILNVLFANQAPTGDLGFRYFALLHAQKQEPTNHGTCCEGSGTRLVGRAPEMIFSYDFQDDTVFVNQFFASSGIANGLNVTIDSDFPFGDQVTLFVSSTSSSPLSKTISIRIPSWVPSEVTILLDGTPLSSKGMPGTYYDINKQWSTSPSNISFSLPKQLRATPYIGLTTIPGHSRVAYEYGPVLLAVQNAWNSQMDVSVLNVANPLEPQNWLIQHSPLIFNVTNSTAFFAPYFSIQGDEYFDVYPAFPQN